MFDFIQEIKEARIYKNGDTLKGKTAEEIANSIFLMIMMLEILRNIDEDYAKKYAIQTLGYENFTAMRNNASDLHNLLAVLNNQDDYSEKIETNSKISVPALQIRRYLRDIENNLKDMSLDRQLFLKLEQFLGIKNSSFKQIRRNVADWRLNSDTEKTLIRRNIKNYLNNYNQQTDILIYFRNLAK